MIYTTTINDSDAFIDLLAKTKQLALQSFNNNINSGEEFENFIFNCMLICCQTTIFDGNIYQTDDKDFPDIVLNNYWGIEIKYTKNNKWTSIGNSILESSRIKNVQKIYLLFGKGGSDFDIIYKPYEACLSGISVTHYPRYEINMNLEKGRSIFDLMNTSYDKLRLHNNPIKKIKQYYQSKLQHNDSLWWLDNDTDNHSRHSSSIITDFSNLDKKEKIRLVAESFILFPEVLNSKYSRLCAFWVSYYSVLCPNMRDQFSAGGKIKISNIANTAQKQLFKKYQFNELSKIYYLFLFKYGQSIYDMLFDIDVKLVQLCWNIKLTNRKHMLDIWQSHINVYGSPYFKKDLSNIFFDITKKSASVNALFVRFILYDTACCLF